MNCGRLLEALYWILNGRNRPCAPILHHATKRPHVADQGIHVRPTFQVLNLSLLRDLQCVIHLDPEVSNSALQLAMAEQELDGS